MSRVQLALNVADLDEAVAFYTKLFDTPPAKVRPGYANFAVEQPPLKLVLIEDRSREPGSINHLGVEVATPGEVVQATARLQGEGMITAAEEGVTCCYARQDKVWVAGPGGQPWEIYAVLADAEPAGDDPEVPPGSGCCGALPDLRPVAG